MITSTSSSVTDDACATTTRAGSAAGCGPVPIPPGIDCSRTSDPEPLGPEFDGGWLRARLRGRTAPIKNLLMDSRIVAGVGNIYANEALFMAGIDPRRGGGRIARRRLDGLVSSIRQVLSTAVAAGGTTLRDYVRADGSLGEYSGRLGVYGRDGEPCPRCAAPIAKVVIGQRTTWFCRRCQR